FEIGRQASVDNRLDTALDAFNNAIELDPKVAKAYVYRGRVYSYRGNYNQAIADYIKKTYNLAIGDKTAEEMKINVGSAVTMDDELSMTIKGRDFLTGLPRSVEIKTNEVVKAVAKELREMIKAIKDVLQETPPELASDIIDNGIIMTGGSSQLRNLPELVYRRTGVKAKLADDPLYCVAKGTGIALEHLNTYKKTIIAKR
ncbi:MAG: rod shape-determining protein, partial [bacterium]